MRRRPLPCGALPLGSRYPAVRHSSPSPAFRGRGGPTVKRWEVRVLLSPVYRPSPPIADATGPSSPLKDGRGAWRLALAFGLTIVATPPAAAEEPSILQQRVEAKLKDAGPGTRFGLVVATEDGREL